MPSEAAKSAERCERHPGSTSVARCARCDRTLCIACAIPVRGTVLGSECLPADVAAGAGTTADRRPPMPGWWLGTGGCLLVLLGSTAFPWTGFGDASGWFGAWGLPLRWSSLVAITAALAEVIWIVRRRPGRIAPWLVAALALLAAAGAALAILNPPPFTEASAAPWVALAAGSAGAALALVAGRRSGR